MRRSISTTLALALAAAALVAVPGSVPAQATSHPVVEFTGLGVAQTEGDGSTTFTFDVALDDPPSTQPVTVDWSTEDGTAIAGEDYTAATGTLTFLPGSTDPVGGGPSVTVTGDDLHELDEIFRVRLSNAANASIGLAAASGHILDDDAPTVTIEGPTDPVDEPGSGETAPATFTVSVPVTHDDAPPVTVHWRTIDRSATSGQDYVGQSAGTVTIPAGGDGTAPLTVTVLGDDDPEGTTPEEFTVELLSATHSLVPDAPADRRADAQIRDTDGPADVVRVLDAVPVEEGTSADPGTATFKIVLSDELGAQVEIPYTTANGTAKAAPDPKPDYDPEVGMATIPAGDTSYTVSVPLVGDTAAEGTEAFTLNLGAPVAGTVEVVRDIAQATVVDDDGPLVTVTEHSGAVEGDPVVFTVSVGSTRTQAVTVDVATTAGTASAGDYTAIAQTLTFPVGTDSQQVSVQTTQDSIDEYADSFRLRLSNPHFARLGTSATGAATIWDDDGPPVITIEDAEVFEGTGASPTPANLTVRLSHRSANDIQVTWSTQPGTAGEGDDYTAVEGATLTIPAGATTATATVDVAADGASEPNETFDVVLVSVEGPASFGEASTPAGTVTIIDDDGARVVVDDASALEGDDGSGGTVRFTVSLQDPSGVDCAVRGACDDIDNPVTVTYVTQDGTGDNGAHADADALGSVPDYVTTTGELTFAIGEHTKTVDVPLVGDDIGDPTLWFTLRLSEASGASIYDGIGVGTIVNDDGPVLTIQDVTVVEGDAGTRDAVVQLGYDGSTWRNNAAVVHYRTRPAPSGDAPLATAGSDYLATAGTLAFQGTGQVEIPIIGDASDEGDEVFLVEFYEPDWVHLVDGSGQPVARASTTVTITDDDASAGGTGGTTDGGTDGGTDGSTDGGGSDGGTTDGLEGTGGDGDDGGPDSAQVFRTSGEDRIRTAVAASADHWPSADAAVLSTARAYPDALAGGALAAGLRGPLLLTEPDELPDVVADELERLGVRDVWILGGTAAVSTAVEQAIEDLGIAVTRVAGDDRFETAAKVTQAVQLPPSGEVVLALGHHPDQNRAWPDALSGGSLAASRDQVPTLLTHADRLPDVTRTALAELGAQRVLVLGGPAAISDAVVDELADLGYQVRRLAGGTRYGTTVAVAEEALARQPDGDVVVVFATGANFPDGLSAGALAARYQALVVLVPATDLNKAPEVPAFLRAHADRFDQAVIVGGPVAVSEQVRTELAQAMQAP